MTLPPPEIAERGRPRALSLRDAIRAVLMSIRQNPTEEVIAAVAGVSQAGVSVIIRELTPLLDQATAEERPSVEEARTVAKERLALLDGTLWPCWSWEDARELWAGKYGTTGHGSLVLADAGGEVFFVSDPSPGRDHEMPRLEGAVKEILESAGGVIAAMRISGLWRRDAHQETSPPEALCERETHYNNQLSALRGPVERAVAHLKSWKILFSDYRRPLGTWQEAFRAASGLYFFSMSF